MYITQLLDLFTCIWEVGLLPKLAIRLNVTMNIGVLMYFQLTFSYFEDKCQLVVLLNLLGVLVFFLRNP